MVLPLFEPVELVGKHLGMFSEQPQQVNVNQIFYAPQRLTDAEWASKYGEIEDRGQIVEVESKSSLPGPNEAG